MSHFSLEDLLRIMRECAGEGDLGTLDADAADQPFADLGYDSLALLETASRVERQLNVTIPEEALADVDTPAQFVALVNEHATQLIH